MNDFDYDSMQKKIIARSAKHGKNGSRSRRCVLSTDYLTAAELEKRNGEVMSYKMNEPAAWETFCAWPHDIQEEYINGLQSRFGVGLPTISKELFKGSGSMLFLHAKRNGLTFLGAGKRLSNDSREVWETWLCGGVKTETPAPVEETEEKPETSEDQKFAPQLFMVEFSGVFEPAEFIAQLARLPVPSGRVRIRVHIEKED